MCGIQFLAWRESQFSCSNSCARKFPRKKKEYYGHKHVCDWCSNVFWNRRKDKRFCCAEHFHAWSKGNINIGPKSENHKRKISQAQIGKRKGIHLSLEHRMALSASRLGMKFSKEHRQNLSKSKVEKMSQRFVFGGNQRSYISTKTGEINFAHSSYELRRMNFLDSCSSVKFWTKNHGISIEYLLDGVLKRYIPDFLVEKVDGTKVIDEVKGWVRDHKIFEAKNESATQFASQNGFKYRVLFVNDLEKE
jgi:hypothetical protein